MDLEWRAADKRGLTLRFGTDEARRRVAEGAQDGPDGQAQVLVARVQCHRGEAEVRQLWGFLRADLHVGDLREEEAEMLTFGPVVMFLSYLYSCFLFNALVHSSVKRICSCGTIKI